MTTTIHLANEFLAATPAPNLNLKAGAVWLRGFGLLCVLVILVWLTAKGLIKNGSRGDTSGSISMFTATMISLAPLGLISGIAVITGYGDALLGVFTKILSAE